MKRLFLVLIAPLLSGCVAAVPLYMAASYGLSAFSLYQVYSVGNVKDAEYEVQKSEPAAVELAAIRNAQSIAIFPTNSGVDGAVVDVFDEKSGLTTVSSRTTIEYIETNNVTQERILSYPARDQAIELQKFGRGVASNLVVFAMITDTKVNSNAFIASGNSTELSIRAKILDTATGSYVLDEMHVVKVDVGDTPSNMEIAQLAALGISDRLAELRTGTPR